ARAILRKYDKAVPHLSEIDTFEFSDQEALLICKILEFPDKVIKAADEDNPSILVRHLLDIAGIYNSYYASAPVLKGGRANKSRLMITRATQLTLTNGLKFCHVECPPKI
ncbi:MAG: DALR anticodon-binding domain-containing protein, partial [Acidimicrobiia bacterium]